MWNHIPFDLNEMEKNPTFEQVKTIIDSELSEWLKVEPTDDPEEISIMWGELAEQYIQDFMPGWELIEDYFNTF